MYSIRILIFFYLLTLVACKDEIAIPIEDCAMLEGAFPQFLELPPIGDNGSFDPTMAGDPTTGRVWMVFSRVDGGGGEGQVSSHLAFSDDHGTTWCYSKQINASDKVQLSQLPTEFSSVVSAHWSHEVSSLVYDPNAAADQRWRILWHRYLHVNDGIAGNDDRQFAYGWIAMKTASDPKLLADAPEIKLFSGLGYYKTDATEMYNNAIGGTPIVRLHELHSALSGGVVFTEPGMQVYQNELYVSLLLGSVAEGNSVILLKFTNTTQKWQYVATLLTPADAQAMDASWTNFSATDLFIQDNQAYLLVSPADELYYGVLLFKIDLPTGTLFDSDGNGADVIWSLPKTTDAILTGVATYDALSYNSGILYGDAVISEPQFRIYATGYVPGN